jgi:hypothetical protein
MTDSTSLIPTSLLLVPLISPPPQKNIIIICITILQQLHAIIHTHICIYIHFSSGICTHRDLELHFLLLFCIIDVAKLQQDDGSFAGDEWGEIDTR